MLSGVSPAAAGRMKSKHLATEYFAAGRDVLRLRFVPFRSAQGTTLRSA